jgi:hypothetical protein
MVKANFDALKRSHDELSEKLLVLRYVRNSMFRKDLSAKNNSQITPVSVIPKAFQITLRDMISTYKIITQYKSRTPSKMNLCNLRTIDQIGDFRNMQSSTK